MDWIVWERRFEDFLHVQMEGDAGHDLAHIHRVVKSAKELAGIENAKLEVVIPAAWLHDCVTVAKDSPDRSRASRIAAESAVTFLTSQNYPPEYLDAIAHAIEAHSFSANIPTQSKEAEVVQDADRLDSLGAIGIARCLMTGVSLNRRLYDPSDPFADNRPPDDAQGSIEHFYTKLLTLAGTMKTAAGKAEAEKRSAYMEGFLAQLRGEIGK